MISHVGGFKSTRGRQLNVQAAGWRDVEGLETEEDLKLICLVCLRYGFSIKFEIVVGADVLKVDLFFWC